AFLAYGLAKRVQLWRRGQPENRFDQWATRLKGALLKSVFHGRIVRENKLYAGIMHAFIFGGFIVLFIGTIIVAVEEDVTVALFGWSFYQGNFYLGFKFAMNMAGLLLIAGVLMAFYRRYVERERIQETAPDDMLVLGFLLVLSVQGFV